MQKPKNSEELIQDYGLIEKARPKENFLLSLMDKANSTPKTQEKEELLKAIGKLIQHHKEAFKTITNPKFLEELIPFVPEDYRDELYVKTFISRFDLKDWSFRRASEQKKFFAQEPDSDFIKKFLGLGNKISPREMISLVEEMLDQGVLFSKIVSFIEKIKQDNDLKNAAYKKLLERAIQERSAEKILELTKVFDKEKVLVELKAIQNPGLGILCAGKIVMRDVLAEKESHFFRPSDSNFGKVLSLVSGMDYALFGDQTTFHAWLDAMTKQYSPLELKAMIEATRKEKGKTLALEYVAGALMEKAYRRQDASWWAHPKNFITNLFSRILKWWFGFIEKVSLNGGGSPPSAFNPDDFVAWDVSGPASGHPSQDGSTPEPTQDQREVSGFKLV